MGGDGQTVLILAGTGTTKFSVGLFRGVNSYFGGLAPQYFCVGCLPMGGDGQTVLIFRELALQNFRSDYLEVISWGDWHHNIFGWIVCRWVVMDRLF